MSVPDTVQDAIRELWTQCADAWGMSIDDAGKRTRGYIAACQDSTPAAIRAAIVPALRTLDRQTMSPAKFHALVLQQERQRSRIAESRRGAPSLCVYCGTTETTNPIDPTVRLQVQHYPDCTMSEHGTKFREPPEDTDGERLTPEEVHAHGAAWRERMGPRTTPTP